MFVITDKYTDVIVAIRPIADIVENGIYVGGYTIGGDPSDYNIFNIEVVADSVRPEKHKCVNGEIVANPRYVDSQSDLQTQIDLLKKVLDDLLMGGTV